MIPTCSSAVPCLILLSLMVFHLRSFTRGSGSPSAIAFRFVSWLVVFCPNLMSKSSSAVNSREKLFCVLLDLLLLAWGAIPASTFSGAVRFSRARAARAPLTVFVSLLALIVVLSAVLPLGDLSRGVAMLNYAGMVGCGTASGDTTPVAVCSPKALASPLKSLLPVAAATTITSSILACSWTAFALASITSTAVVGK